MRPRAFTACCAAATAQVGGLTRTLLGSVSEYCVQYAPCPCLVVRNDQAAVAF